VSGRVESDLQQFGYICSDVQTWMRTALGLVTLLSGPRFRVVRHPHHHAAKEAQRVGVLLPAFDFELPLRNDLLAPKLSEEIGEGRT